MIKEPYVPTTGSVACYVRVWRTANWPNGILYWDAILEIEQPMRREQAEALYAERWRPYRIYK